MKRSGIIRHCLAIIFSVAIIILSATGQTSYIAQPFFANFNPGNDITAYAGPMCEAKPFIRRNFGSVTKAVAAESTNANKNKPASPISNDIVSRGVGLNGPFDEPAFRQTSFNYPKNSREDIGVDEYPSQLLLIYAKALKEYAKCNDMDTSYAFLSNMAIHCNRKRFFIVNLTTMAIEQAGLVSHGRGQGPTIYDKEYSNEAGSRCTSLGRYKIVNKYKGVYGESYRMMGLDSTNSNATRRNLVLHSMNCIPDVENVYPACVSDGCPAVSASFLAALGHIIETRKKPILLWIFDSNLQEPVLRPTPEIISLEISLTPKSFPEIAAPRSSCELHEALARVRRQSKLFGWIPRHGKKTQLPELVKENPED